MRVAERQQRVALVVRERSCRRRATPSIARGRRARCCRTAHRSVTPSNWRSEMKFTTPDIASEPYTAEAPPVMVCTLDRIDSGTRLMSTVPKMSASGRRRPSSSTRLRFAPSACRFTVAWPPVPCPPLPAVPAGCELRQLIERRFQRDGAALLQILQRRDDDGARRDAIRIADQRAGDDHFLQLLIRRVAFCGEHAAAENAMPQQPRRRRPAADDAATDEIDTSCFPLDVLRHSTPARSRGRPS